MCINYVCASVHRATVGIVLVPVDGIASTSIKITLSAHHSLIYWIEYGILTSQVAAAAALVYIILYIYLLYGIQTDVNDTYCHAMASFAVLFLRVYVPFDLASFSFTWRVRKETHTLSCQSSSFGWRVRQKILFLSSFHLASFSGAVCMYMSNLIAKDVNNMDLHIKCNCVNCNSLCCVCILRCFFCSSIIICLLSSRHRTLAHTHNKHSFRFHKILLF